jgi:hypothetical protein
MHPRYASYGLGDADSELISSFKFAARQAGWSPPRIEQAFEWYRDNAVHIDSMTLEQKVASFEEYTSARGWTDGELGNALAWFDTAASAIDRGEAPPMPPVPTPAQDQMRRAELEKLMRENPDAYWRDPQVQDELYEINARADGSAGPVVGVAPAEVPAVPAAPTGRRAEIETMMRQAPSEYWGNPGVQAEYRALLAEGGGGGAAPAGEVAMAAPVGASSQGSNN